MIFLGAWLAAPVELRGSRTRVGRYRRRRRGTPNADDNLVCVGMKIGFVAVSGFSERADSYYNGGGKSVKFRWPGDGCGEEGVSKGMEAFVRDSHVAETAGHRPCPNGVTITRVQHPVETPADQPPRPRSPRRWRGSRSEGSPGCCRDGIVNLIEGRRWPVQRTRAGL